MNRKDVISHQSLLIKFININKIMHVVFIVVMVSLYSLSLYCLVEEHAAVAIVLATGGFILAKLFLRYSVYISRYIFSYGKGTEEVLLFIDKELKEKGQNRFISVLGNALKLL